MRQKTRVSAAALAVSLALAGCGTPASQESEQAETTRLELEFERTTARIDSLRAETQAFGESVRGEIDSQLVVLEARRDTARVRLAELKQAGERGWGEARHRFEEARTQVERAVEAVRRALDRAPRDSG